MAKTIQKHGGEGQGEPLVHATGEPAMKPDTQPVVQGDIIFWAPASGYQLANWQREIKESGHIAQPEKPLRFSNHTCVTSDPEMISFIKNSDAFRRGRIKIAPDMQTAMGWTAIQGRRKAQIQTTVSVDNALYTEDGQETSPELASEDKAIVERAMKGPQNDK